MKTSLIFLWCVVSFLADAQQRRPNVIIIITDDQGYGDFGWTGNPNVKTPAIDQLARESVRFRNFYVSPVCAPTRASLMTGRYSLHTGVRDTYNGGAMMATEETTLAEMLKANGYTTAIFGKWHLGDNFPMRPIDQGFDESLVHLSGGMAQVGDFTTYFRGDSSYFDPVLWHNGKPEAHEGYCTDVFTREAIAFIEKNRERPFFCYLSFNAPHTPLQVQNNDLQQYRDADPLEGIPAPLRPKGMTEKDKDDARKVYGMVSNIDHNVGSLLEMLRTLNLHENTILLFLTDNGPQQTRYNAGLRGLKGSVYEGGIRTPALLRYPAMFPTGRDVDGIAAHIDVLPTLAEICNVPPPSDRVLDGRSLLGAIEGNPTSGDRSLFFYWSRKLPERYFNVALRKGKYKLVGHADYNASLDEFELYDLDNDPFEKSNLIAREPATGGALKNELDLIFDELITSPHLKSPPLIVIGSPEENPVVLNRNDAAGERGIWAQENAYGVWRVKIKPGRYNIKFRFLDPVPANGKLVIETGTFASQMINNESLNLIVMKNVVLPETEGEIVPFYEHGSQRMFPFWVEFEKHKQN